MPSQLQEDMLQTHDLTHALEDKGRGFLREVYGDVQAKNIEGALYALSPRLGYYSVPLVYGGIYSDQQAISTREVSLCLLLLTEGMHTHVSLQYGG